MRPEKEKGEKTMVLIVTRHQALVDYIKENTNLLDGVDNPVYLSHANKEDVAGKDVIGVLPLYLAAEAKTVTEVVLENVPQELRGQELDLSQIKKIPVGIRRYKVEEVEI